MHASVDLLEECSWSRSVREEIIKVVELSHSYNEQKRFMFILGESQRDCKDTLVEQKEERLSQNESAAAKMGRPSFSRSIASHWRCLKLQENTTIMPPSDTTTAITAQANTQCKSWGSDGSPSYLDGSRSKPTVHPCPLRLLINSTHK